MRALFILIGLVGCGALPQLLYAQETPSVPAAPPMQEKVGPEVELIPQLGPQAVADKVPQKDSSEPAEEAEEEESGFVMKSPEETNTLIFDDQESRALYNAMDAHLREIEQRKMDAERRKRMAKLEKDAPQGKPGQKNTVPQQKKVKVPSQPKPYEINHPQFYMSLLAYHKPDDWVVQVNAFRFDPSNKRHGELKILSITEEEVAFLWQPELDMVYATRAPNKISGNGILKQEKGKEFRFTLRPNQSFSAYDLRIVEGKLPAIRKEVVLLSPDIMPVGMQPITTNEPKK